jgi:hypothetical protein
VLLDALPQQIELDSEWQTVRVSGGVSYGALCRTLQQSGVAIHNLASLPHISVAGAVELPRGFRTAELVDCSTLPALAVDNHSGLR